MKLRSSPLLPLVLQATAVAAGFIHWGHHEDYMVHHHKLRGPYENDDHEVPYGYEVVCENTKTFHAKQYKKSDFHVHPPQGMSPWAEAVESFIKHREYPGHWKGEDEGVKDRKYLVMEYADVPRAVRDWIEHQQRKDVDQHNKWLFAVFEKPEYLEKIHSSLRPPPASPTAASSAGSQAETEEVKITGEEDLRTVPDSQKILFFAAGALYEILPLWVAEGSNCEADFKDMHNYHPFAQAGGVIAYPIKHTSPESKVGLKNMSFTIKAMKVDENEETKVARRNYEKMMRATTRHMRKIERANRARGEGIPDDSPIHEEL